MRFRLLVSIAVPLAAFSITCLVLLRQQRGAETAEATPAAADSAQLERPIAAGRGAAPRPSPPMNGPTREIEPAPPPASKASVLSGPGPAGDEMPVKFMVRPARGESAALATLLNVSDATLDVNVTAVNPQTHMRSAVTVSVLPHQRLNLAEAGLVFAPGDEVTLQSPPFRDSVVQAR
jgi:hypothetical protein